MHIIIIICDIRRAVVRTLVRCLDIFIIDADLKMPGNKIFYTFVVFSNPFFPQILLTI